jgi:hypothetical protein
MHAHFNLDESPQAPTKDRQLARLAGACLGGSALLAPGLLFLLALASNPAVTITADPVASVSAMVVASAFFISVWALGRLARKATADPRRLWWTSLVCNLAIVAIIANAFGIKAGLIICIMEVLAIAIHIVALARRTTPVSGALSGP